MDGTGLTASLRAIRRLRRARLDPAEVPASLHPLLADGLGAACDRLAHAVDTTVTDPRGAEAAIRFFGLDRLPEDLAAIGNTLRARPGGRPLEGPIGISTRQVENLIAAALDDLDRHPPVAGPGTQSPPEPSDPFPQPMDDARRSAAERLLWWAWAQVPDGDRNAAASLLFYEQEHGLRDLAPTPASRTERARWRRLAWSVLQVAQHRLDVAYGAASDRLATDRALGPRRLALVEVAASEPADEMGYAALAELAAGAPAGPGALECAVDLVDTAVRSGRPGAGEMLGILREACRGRPGSAAPRVSAWVEARILTMAAILAREHRDVAGLAAGYTALHRIGNLLSRPGACGSAAARRRIRSRRLRICQELARLHDGLGRPEHAVAVLATMHGLIRDEGDPDQAFEPDGWEQQYLLTTASIHRRLARNGDREELRAAEAAADRATELVFDHGVLPPAWGVAAATQRVSTAVDRLAGATGQDRRSSLDRDVDLRFEELTRQCHALPGTPDHAHEAALVGLRLLGWRIALIRRDRRAVEVAREHTIRSIGPWMGGAELEQVHRYQRAGRSLGIGARSIPSLGHHRHLHDRAALYRDGTGAGAGAHRR